MYKFCKAIVKILFKICYKIKVEGEITLPDTCGYMICSNHIHAFDPAFIACFTKRQISFMGKKELFEIPILNKFFRKLGGFPVDRGKGDIQAIKPAIGILISGNIMAMFPEGTRSKDGKIGKFKRGASIIASRAQVPIIPVKIEGAYRMFSRMTLKIGKPLYPTSENKNLTNDLYETIISL